ncbi:MAG: thioredoxin family protein [Deltaproteobacteria bacterium]|nr:thioredoxin family protein [Deltaproteobacteria bacterium]
MWQTIYDELKEHNFMLISVALDCSADDPRPFVEAAQATHPCLVDTEHTLADLYRVINVPTVLWIGENGQVVRPNDAVFANNALKDMHGIDCEVHHAALRAWVKENTPPLRQEDVKDLQILPTLEEQQARAEFALGWYLHQQGKAEAAERHFRQADKLAPFDFTIRRGSMPIRGMDPFGADFADLFSEWIQAGRPYYKPIPTGDQGAD